jgi:methionyl-tRNA formyltransferase
MQDIVIFLSGARGLPVARAVAAAGHGIARIVVPDNAAGANLVIACQDIGIPVRAARDVNGGDFLTSLSKLTPQLLVVAGYPTIFRRPLLDIAHYGAINLHGGRLPQYRGGSPLNWQILNGEPVAGISVIRLDEGIDTGDVLAEAEIVISSEDTIADVHARANELFPDLTVRVIARLEQGLIAGRKQNEDEACYWHQRNDGDGHIAWDALNATDASNFVRAITRPYPGAFAYCEGARVRLYEAGVPPLMIRGAPGRVCYVQRIGPYVACRDRAILVGDYEFEGDTSARLRHGTRLN